MCVLQSTFGQRHQGLIQGVGQTVILVADPPAVRGRPAGCVGRDGEDRAQVQTVALPMRHPGSGIEHVDPADRLVEAAETELGQHGTDVLGDELEEVLHEFRFAVEPGPQFGILGGHSHRAGIQMTDAHHDAPRHHQRGGGKAVLLGPQQRGHHDIARGAHPTITLHRDAVA